MSDYRAIAATTVTLQNVLTEAIREAVPGAAVATGPPPARTGHELTEGLINVFLYKVEPNSTWRNEELPFRSADGSWIRKPQLAINLFYLLSFYGDDLKQIPNLLLGTALAALHAEPYPHRRHFPHPRPEGQGQGAFADGSPNLAGSGLLSQRHGLSFSLLSSEQDEVIQTWAQLLHQPYILSVAYIARVVLIEPDVVPVAALPARRTDVRLHSGQQPELSRVTPAVLPFAPNAELTLTGRNFSAPQIRVAIGELEVEPLTIAPERITILLPPRIQAGIQPVAVVHGEEQDDGARRRSFASNTASVVVLPVLHEAVWHPRASVVASTTNAPALDTEAARTKVTGTLELRFAPAVTAPTDAELLLNAIPSTADDPKTTGYVFATTIDPSSPDRAELNVTVAPGRYLARLRVLGATSPLQVDEDPASSTYGRYIGPAVDMV